MSKLETILEDVRSLSPAERTKLVSTLVNEVSHTTDSEEVAVGQRGLAAWTESTREEDWSAFYPEW